ncbi:MAG: hypothetical protein GY714_15060 [Desulfobacterales bacterium]|nr:hypothetical protein [Desulfobacterales bacterium]MCP4162128.1 hypothetical protein [Deltaproteobacteria bacterium]
MVEKNLISIIIHWTPELLKGLYNNVLISTTSMVIGTVAGLFVVVLKKHSNILIKSTGNGFTNLVRNVPSFVLLFYLAFILPSSFTFGESEIIITPSFKTIVALTFPVIGFTSDAVIGFMRTRDEQDINPYVVFWSGWSRYFVIVLMASSTASVIGVNEVVAKTNLLIAAVNNPNYTLLIYFYTSLIFLATGLLISTVSNVLIYLFVKE